jgi:tetratricopeptide (TPR) repeat protein
MNAESEFDDDLDDDESYEQIGKPICPFCEPLEVCKHVVFNYDLTFCERKSGRWEEIDELETILKNGFLDLMVNNKKVGFIEQFHQYCEPDNKYIEELWHDARANYNPNDHKIDFKDDTFIRLLIYIFDYSISPGDAFIKRYGSGGVTNFDSAMVACFADDVTKRINDVKEIIKEFLNDIEFDSEDPKEYNYRGLTQSIERYNHSAITSFSKALYLDPEYAEAYFNRGNAKWAIWDNLGAEADYRKALNFNPKNTKYQKKIKELEENKKK